MGVWGYGGWAGGVRLGEGRQEYKHFMNKQLSLTHVEKRDGLMNVIGWMKRYAVVTRLLFCQLLSLA